MPNSGNEFFKKPLETHENRRIPKIASFYQHTYVKIVCNHHKRLCLTGLVRAFILKQTIVNEVVISYGISQT